MLTLEMIKHINLAKGSIYRGEKYAVQPKSFRKIKKEK